MSQTPWYRYAAEKLPNPPGPVESGGHERTPVFPEGL